MSRSSVLAAIIGAALGSGRGGSPAEEPARATTNADTSTFEEASPRKAATFAAMRSTARLHVTAVCPPRPTDPLAEAPLADESTALRARRADGSTLTSFRRGREFYELSDLPDDGEVVWLVAIDRDSEDDAPPLALVGIHENVLGDGAVRSARVAIDRRSPHAGRATVIARVVDDHGAPKAHVRAFHVQGAEGPRVDDASGELVDGEASGPRGVVVYDDVDASDPSVALKFATERGARTVHARIMANVVTSMVIAIE